MRALANAIRRFPYPIGICVIAGLACGLYLPFLANPLVFDDLAFFTGSRFAYYATHPLGLELRVPPTFTLAFVQVLWGSIEAHRIASLAFHIACSLALYKLVYELLDSVRESELPAPTVKARPGDAVVASVSAGIYAIHPVAVYAAGYLAQRSIVLATLFSLLSAALFLRGLTRGSHQQALYAALMYTLAVLCKEHSAPLPLAVLVLTPLLRSQRGFAIRHAAIYAAGCAPVAIFAVLLRSDVLGAPYEPEVDTITAQVELGSGHDIPDIPWWLSAVTQAGLFFRYGALWLWPDTGAMSVDLRVDFADAWSLSATLLALAGFSAYGLLGLNLVVRRAALARIAGFALLFPWILYWVELSTVRFQEPFVLYRSYLWAPGWIVLFALALSRVSIRAVAAIALVVLPLLSYQAYDRLGTFASGLALWEDAVAKLPREPVPGGSRTLYHLGREYLYGGRPDRAAEVAEHCIAQYPATYDCHMARAAIHLEQEEFEQALSYLNRALELRPGSGLAHHHLGLALENLGRLEEAKTLYRRASALGFKGADYQIMRLETPGSGLLPPKVTGTR